MMTPSVMSAEAMEKRRIVAAEERCHTCCRKWRPQYLIHRILDK
jgi:hypothetical protein